MEIEVLIPSLIGYVQLFMMGLFIAVAIPMTNARVQKVRNFMINDVMPKKRFFGINLIGFAVSFFLSWEEFAAMFAINMILGAVFYFMLRPFLKRKYSAIAATAKAQKAEAVSKADVAVQK